MSGPEMVVWIVGLVMAVAAFKAYMRHKADIAAANMADDGDVQGQIQALEARIVTLEKIATDPAERLKQSIDQL